jgi:hypothetical protein
MAQPVVNHTIAELNKLSLNLSDKIRGNSELKMKMVTVILPDREAEGPIQVSVDSVRNQADQIIKIWQNKVGMPLPDITQTKVNNLYNGLVNAINLAPAPAPRPVAAPRPQVQGQAQQRPAPSRRGGKYSKRRRNTKRRNTKRRNTKRRRNNRK